MTNMRRCCTRWSAHAVWIMWSWKNGCVTALNISRTGRQTWYAICNPEKLIWPLSKYQYCSVEPFTCIVLRKHNRVMATWCCIQIKVFNIKAINTKFYSAVMRRCKVWVAEGITWIIRRWEESFADLKVNGLRRVVMVILVMQYAI